MMPTRDFWIITGSLSKYLILFGERAGDRTQDPVIKSYILVFFLAILSRA